MNINKSVIEKYEEIGKMLGSMANNPERFLPKGYKISEELLSYGDDTD